jgi:transcriptional regulator with GAF, ATPase, and Fis domain
VHRAWLKCFDSLDERTAEAAVRILADSGIGVEAGAEPEEPSSLGLVLLRDVTSGLVDWLRSRSRHTTVLAIVLTPRGLPPEQEWQLMAAGAADVLVWQELPPSAVDISARLDRLQEIGRVMRSAAVQQCVVGESAIWRTALREVVEVGAFTDASTLIVGESGTGKELLAQLIHDLDRRRNKGDFVILDCAAITPELSGSEFFGHERGAFTGAVIQRDGAFAMANGGTLFLDEVGELPLPLQAQLLRAVQEHKYKRVGSNVWQHTQFRLVCATNRDLEACVSQGRFRGDLYHRIAGWVCRVPPLRERPEDILPLTAHFLSQLNQARHPVGLDRAVQQYLLTREYPGNVRDLRQLVTRIWHRHAGPGAITPGDIPRGDRPTACATGSDWQTDHLETAIRRALELGIGLKEIGRAAAEAAIRIALEQEHENVHRAAVRLGLTDRAVQLRRATRRPS